MIFHDKCSWTIALAALIPILSLNVNLCISSPAYDLQPSNSNAFKENAHDTKANPTVESNEHNNKDNRNWSKFASWGKRKLAKDKALLRNKKWMNFSVWGKRSENIGVDDFAQFLPYKRNWHPFVSWGKRAAKGFTTAFDYSNTRALDADKRAWSTLPTWGKRVIEEGPVQRMWAQLPNWGKLTEGFDDNSYTNSEEIDTTEGAGYLNDKRNWSKLVSWRKRASSVNDNLGSFLEDKRKWSTFPTWGKRNEDDIYRWNLRNGRWFQGSTLGRRDLVTQSMNNKPWIQFEPWVKRSLDLNAWNNRLWSPIVIINEQDDQGSFNNQPDYDIDDRYNNKSIFRL